MHRTFRSARAAFSPRLHYAGFRFFSDAFQPEVSYVSLPIPHLPASLSGLRIAQLSDIHLNKRMRATHLMKAVQIVAELSPDYVFLTGDYVSDHGDHADQLIEPLRQLPAPAYAIWGNHDYYNEVARVRRALRETPVRILQNEAVQVAPELYLAGLDDALLGRPDLKAAMKSVPTDAFTLLLVHEPDYFASVLSQQAPVAGQFSGHTHGGQIRLPALRNRASQPQGWAPVLPELGHQYPLGLYQIEERFVYTNRGLGFSGFPLRVNCEPEITLFTLHHPDQMF